MNKTLALPFADHLKLNVLSEKDGKSHLQLLIKPFHLNRHDVLSGGAIYSLADVGMGLALYPTLKKEEICATIEIKTSYFNAVKKGTVDCHTKIIKRGKKIIFLESEITQGETILAKASGSYLVFNPSKKKNDF